MGLFSRKRSRDVAAGTDDDERDDPEAHDVGDDAADDDSGAGDDAPAAEAGDRRDDDATAEGDADPEGGGADEDDAGDADADADADDEDDEDVDDDEDVEDLTGQVEFELADWGARERQMLDGELAAARVRRAWEASTLVVAASDADVVDDLIDVIEERIALDLPADAETVVYGVDDWPLGLEERFIEALIENRIAHRRDFREVAVAVESEGRVDELVDEVTAAWEDEQPSDDELDGPDAQQVLSELFVSSDRLMHDASDKAATVRFDDASTLAVDMALPFGFDEDDWGRIVDLTSALRDRLADVDATDDEIVEAATDLRTHLRPLV